MSEAALGAQASRSVAGSARMDSTICEMVQNLLDTQKDAYGSDVSRLYTREQAAEIIHAALLGYGLRADSAAARVVLKNFMDALGV